MSASEFSGEFAARHIGPDETDIAAMLERLGEPSLDALIDKVVPKGIRSTGLTSLGDGVSEQQALAELRELAARNQVLRSCIGQGYYGTIMPEVLKRNVLESPAWYTAYTPYQPEIAQGRLEVLFNFQTLVSDLTGLEIANASLLDEATAVAEAMAMCHRIRHGKRSRFYVAADCHPQTIDVLQTRAEPIGIELLIREYDALAEVDDTACGVLLQYPSTTGEIRDPSALCDAWHAVGALVVFAADPLALVLLESPGKLGADIAIGSMQRYGVPMGFGGPHAAYMATRSDYKRNMPGRLIGLSVDAGGNPAYRLALQTREQHIRREKATSNICTAQALLAILATLYACYHGPAGLRRIAMRVHRLCETLKQLLLAAGVEVRTQQAFDTLLIECPAGDVLSAARAAGFNLCPVDDRHVGVSVDETTSLAEIGQLAALFTGGSADAPVDPAGSLAQASLPAALCRDDDLLRQPCFLDYRSETEMMRYLRRMADMDLALDRAMIPLGSCTMKLNAAAEMAPVSWPEFADIHPFAPEDQTTGYREMIHQLEQMLCACTGYDAVSLQPNAGSQGEFAGLLAIHRYHQSRGEADRNICLIPSSAHGTNPASAQMAGMKVVVVACDDQGNIDLADLQNKLDRHRGKVAAIMITYPSTHGVFEEQVRDVCARVHDEGGQVYIDGANLNAMVGLAEPGRFGGDVSHLNLHKTFCIPHGGGGPGVGPIGVGEHLVPFLPGHRQLGNADNTISAAPYGSAMILPITWMYIRMMGRAGLEQATRLAILNANYLAAELGKEFPILYRGEHGYVAHECIVDTRAVKNEAGVSVEDFAKRLIDYGFHAPTMSFPVSGTLMVEPTESESRRELDRFIRAIQGIRREVADIVEGRCSPTDNPLVNAPHTAQALMSEKWDHCYPREYGGWPDGEARRTSKYWPPVARVDNVYGDKHLICTCPPLESYTEEA